MSVDAVLRPGRTLHLPERRPALVASAALLANAGPAATTPPAAAAAAAAASPAAAPAGAAAAAVEDSSESGRSNGGVYVVRRGEALSDIARNLHLSAADLIRYNHLRDADFVFEGQKLRTTADPGGPEADESALAAAVSPVTVDTVSTVPGPMLARAPDKFAAPGDAGSILRVAADLGGGGAATLFPVGSNTGDRPRIVSFEGLPDRGKAEPVSRSQAEALGPSLVPGGGATPQVTDVVDYSVAPDGSVHVAAAETIGHYAEWLGVSAARLRTLNHLGSGRSLLVGQKLRLDFSRAKLEQFEQRRRDYHARLQSDFFDAHRIEGTEIYVARRGDSLWTVTQRYPRLPAWLLEEYNPDTDFGELRPGTQLVVPQVEDVAAAN
jgi:membrane-bound lytic murein transglycosylase D